MISPGLFIPPDSNPYALNRQSEFADLVGQLLKAAPREFLIAMAAGVEMESRTEQTPDGRDVFTIQTVPLVGTADLGDGRITVFTRERPNDRKSRGSVPSL